MGFGFGNIDYWRAIAVDSDVAHFMRDDAAARVHSTLGVLASCSDKFQGGQPFTPRLTAQSQDTPTFLVDCDWAFPTYSIALVITKRTHLIRCIYITGEKDETKRVHIPKQRHFICCQPKAIPIRDGRAKAVHRVTTGIQSAFLAKSAEQKRRASLRSEKPIARRR